jgi:hypothetical protein
MMKWWGTRSESQKALIASLGIDVKSSEVLELIKPVDKLDDSSDWIKHKEKTDNGVAAEATEGGADWENITEGCDFEGSLYPVVFIEMGGPDGTAWFVYEQVPSDNNASALGASALGANPCGAVDWDNSTKQPSGTWECKGR